MINKRIKIKAVGDIAPGDYVAHGLGVLSITKKYGCDYLFKKIINELKDSDLLLGNLEGSLSHLSKKRNLRLCGLPEMALSLRNAGFDVLSVANNHVLDHGPDIFHETIVHCEHAGLMICGLRGKSEYYSQPVIIEKRGMKIGILAYNWVGSNNDEHASEYIAQIHDGIVNYSWERDRIRDNEAKIAIKTKNKHVINDIHELRKHVDIIVLMPHWGYEWTNYPPYGVTIEARTFIDAGTDIILGSHPHVPQGVEVYKNKLIVYSLGNFIFDSFSRKHQCGMLIDCTVPLNENPEYMLSFNERDVYYRPSMAKADAANSSMELVGKSSAAIIDIAASHFLDDDLIYREYEKEYNILKIKKIAYLLKMTFLNPFLIKVVSNKLLSFLKIIFQRIMGKKIRW